MICVYTVPIGTKWTNYTINMNPYSKTQKGAFEKNSTHHLPQWSITSQREKLKLVSSIYKLSILSMRS